jgi:hypothetical protein
MSKTVNQQNVVDESVKSKSKREHNRSEWVGQHTRNERALRLIGGSRYLINDKNFQRITTGTDPTDYEATLDYICEHPQAEVLIV